MEGDFSYVKQEDFPRTLKKKQRPLQAKSAAAEKKNSDSCGVGGHASPMDRGGK